LYVNDLLPTSNSVTTPVLFTGDGGIIISERDVNQLTDLSNYV